MARYRKVDPRIWNDSKFGSLSDSGKLVFFFLLTHPNMTSLGAMRHTIPGMAAELGWCVEAFRKAFGEAFAKGMLEHDEKACFVWLPNFLKYNKPESPNVVKSWVDSLSLLPECGLFYELLGHVNGILEGLPKAFGEALPKAFAKTMPNQEQEQEQEQEKDNLAHPEAMRGCEASVFPLRRTASNDQPTRLVAKQASGVLSAGFEDFWAAYPRKKSKGQAQKAWEKLHKAKELPDLSVILNAIAAAKTGQDWQRDGGKFIPHPATWLNASGWEDESACDLGLDSKFAGAL